MAKYNITSSSQLIDTVAITNGCAIIEAAAKKFGECAKIVESASNICNEDALSVDKTTMQPQLIADAEYIKSIEDAILNFTIQIKNVAVQIYAEQTDELAKYIAAQQAKNNN